MSAVLYSSSDRIGVITLNRPEARNAVDREMALGLEAAVDRLEDDPEVWVGVLVRQHRGPGAPGLLRRAPTSRSSGRRAPRRRSTPSAAASAASCTASGRSRSWSRSTGSPPRAGWRSCSPPTSWWPPPDRRSGSRRCGTTSSPRPAGCSGSARDRSGGGDGRDPHRRADRRALARYDLGLVSRLVEPGAALDEALRVARQIVAAAPLAVRASRRVVLAAAHADDDHAARSSPERCSTSCSRPRTRAKGCARSPRSGRPSGRGADARARRGTVAADAAHRSERRPRAARSGRRVATRSSTRRRRCSRAAATTPPASPSCARSTASARARSTTTSGRRRSSSPRSTIA